MLFMMPCYWCFARWCGKHSLATLRTLRRSWLISCLGRSMILKYFMGNYLHNSGCCWTQQFSGLSHCPLFASIFMKRCSTTCQILHEMICFQKNTDDMPVFLHERFVSAGEHKWLQQTGLVMLLPHGYMGPDLGNAHFDCSNDWLDWLEW